ncbi:MAG TPA: GNAT family N-acetyltransferase [Myxococcota bacterium]|nr:GNAT family N-acetyltransferase [Myxococcota bacterium]
MPLAPIVTPRLELVPMTPAFLEASLAGDLARAADLLGASLPPEWPDAPKILRLRLGQLRNDPAAQAWLTRALVLRAEGRVVGHAGFHTRPGEPYLEAWAPGGVELGYTVFARDRRRGFAREACTALMDWATRAHGITRFVASISPANEASLALARGLGFERVGSALDDEDGPEDVHVREVAGA